ncbi:MAG: protein translocase subunit SecF [bacterium]
MQFLIDAKIDFIGKRKVALLVSALLILVGIGSLIIHGGPNYSIDFLGGTTLAYKFQNEISIADVRNAVSKAGFSGSEIKNFGSGNEILIRIEEQEQDNRITTAIDSALTSSFTDNSHKLEMRDTVGPRIGSELRTAATLSILIAMFFILLYISWRFEFIFAVGAIIAVFHDVLITLGVFSILRLELSLAIIAAFLTIVGYSLNDTIVVFDRIRENLKLLRRDTYEKIINTSINQSLSRTVITSLTTLIVVLILYIFGSEVIRNFAFALIVGVIVGTYSSVFIASPILVEWQMRRETKKGRPMTKRA